MRFVAVIDLLLPAVLGCFETDLQSQICDTSGTISPNPYWVYTVVYVQCNVLYNV